MNRKSRIIPKVNNLVCLLVVFLLVACSPSQPVQDVGDVEPAEVDSPAPPLEEAPVEPPQEEAAPIEPVDPPAAPPSDGVVWMEDMIYPGAEFLLEVDGFGGPNDPLAFLCSTQYQRRSVG